MSAKSSTEYKISKELGAKQVCEVCVSMSVCTCVCVCVGKEREKLKCILFHLSSFFPFPTNHELSSQPTRNRGF